MRREVYRVKGHLAIYSGFLTSVIKNGNLLFQRNSSGFGTGIQQFKIILFTSDRLHQGLAANVEHLGNSSISSSDASGTLIHAEKAHRNQCRFPGVLTVRVHRRVERFGRPITDNGAVPFLVQDRIRAIDPNVGSRIVFVIKGSQLQYFPRRGEISRSAAKAVRPSLFE
ncbi:hypothetical protein BCR41DRAFT_374015 [Lobosporangium transversale]|uniref:Uncharacterized protein n=1 Tax=Lobosporangium transversale TaxID=64571 RepID=A0A1Y2GC26_9FUNG|nr:hypothetical protein BCR41DRAFT_374015 [Lobosporangium transversale]ORZ06602.1 hypothetical protein BCR41DRAFT_374015 [Lobosporangium transversale]|eukprot:XP_021877645.1 hypothetical protein BCR41DRAFT_374015 [Lobosporangium transversale]